MIAILLLPLLASQVVAQFSQLHGLSLTKRQDSSAFVPDLTPVSQCPTGSVECGSSGICYFPAEGDVCCPGGTYACPGSSFCLQDPYCCPEGLDRKTCAEKYGVTLQPTRTQPTVPTSKSKTTQTAQTSHSHSHTTSTPVYKPSVTSSAATSQTATTQSSASTSGPSMPLFTNGVSNREMAGGAIALGGLGLMANLI